MRLGIGSYTYGWAVGAPGGLTALDLLDRAVDLGVGVVQLCDNLPATTWDDANVEQLTQRAAALGLDLELGTRGLARDHLERFILLAERLGSPLLRLVIDSPGDEPSPAEAVDRLRPLRRLLADCGVVLAIENHDRFAAAVLREVIDALNAGGPAQFGVCLDTVNSLGALEGPRVVVETLAPRCVGLHLKDFTIRRLPHLQGFVVEGRPAGEGRLDVPWVLDQLRSAGRDLNAILEQWVPPAPALSETIATEEAWAARGVGFLRRWIAA